MFNLTVFCYNTSNLAPGSQGGFHLPIIEQENIFCSNANLFENDICHSLLLKQSHIELLSVMGGRREDDMW